MNYMTRQSQVSQWGIYLSQHIQSCKLNVRCFLSVGRPLSPIDGGGDDIESLFSDRSNRLNLWTQKVFVRDRTGGRIQNLHDLACPNAPRGVGVLIQKFPRGLERKRHLAIRVVHMAVCRSGCLRSRGHICRLLRPGLRLHVQEGVRPEDLGTSPGHPVARQRSTRVGLDLRDFWCAHGWRLVDLLPEKIFSSIHEKEDGCIVALTDGVEQLGHVLDVLTLLCR